MVLNYSYIPIELSLPVNVELYNALKKANKEDLFNNLLKKFDSQNLFITCKNNNQFNIDILIPKNYKKGNKTCLFIHGSGSSKLSSRNKYVANGLLDMGICCCLMNLFTTREEEIDKKTSENRFNIELLTSRVLTVIEFLLNIDQLIRNNQFTDYINCKNHNEELSVITEYLSIIPKNKMILFGSSTGAAAAIYSAYFKQEMIAGVISRGGRPDLVPSYIIENFPCYNTLLNGDNNKLTKDKNSTFDIIIPVLFIIGSNDYYVAPLNRKTFNQIGKELELKEKQNIYYKLSKNLTKDSKKFNSLSNLYNNQDSIDKSSNSNDNFMNISDNHYKKEWRWIENASHLFTENGAMEKVLYYTKEWIKKLN